MQLSLYFDNFFFFLSFGHFIIPWNDLCLACKSLQSCRQRLNLYLWDLKKRKTFLMVSLENLSCLACWLGVGWGNSPPQEVETHPQTLHLPHQHRQGGECGATNSLVASLILKYAQLSYVFFRLLKGNRYQEALINCLRQGEDKP